MNRKMLLLTIAVSLIALGLLLTVLDTYSQEQDPDQVSGSETAFSYQGYLTSGEASAEGPFDFSFALYGAEAGLPQVGPTIPMPVTLTAALGLAWLISRPTSLMATIMMIAWLP